MHYARLTVLLIILSSSACSPIIAGLPIVVDEKLEHYVTEVALEIVEVSEHRNRLADYRIRLADFSRRDILGLSIGNQRIFISYELSRLAYHDSNYRWLLRHTLAHEIAHEVLGREPAAREIAENQQIGLANSITSRDLGMSSRIKFLPFSRAAELAADRKGMEYWQRLGWDCGHWVRLFIDFAQRGYVGDVDHPTEERLEQASRICSQQSRESRAAH
jgi:predicted Zn-dependent protease